MKDSNKTTCVDPHNKKTRNNLIKIGVAVTVLGFITVPSIANELSTPPKSVYAQTTETTNIEKEVNYASANIVSTKVLASTKEELEDVITEDTTDNWINHIPSSEQKKIADFEYQKKTEFYRNLYATPIEDETEVIIASATTKEDDEDDRDTVEVVTYDDSETNDYSGETDTTPVETTDTTETDSSSDSDMTFYGTLQLTAYTWTGNPCADGVYPSSGYTVACNNSDLWHKWIYIEGMGTYYVHDTGGMACGVIDIYMDSYDACIQFGRQSANIYVLN